MTPQTTSGTRLQGRRMLAARAIWTALVLLALVIGTASLVPYYKELRVPCAGETCFSAAIAPEEAQALQEAGLSMEFYAGFKLGQEIFSGIVYILLGLLIFWRGSADRMGLLVSLTLVLAGVFFSDMPAALVNEVPRMDIPVNLLTSLSVVGFFALLFLFPDGRFVPRWTRMIIAIMTLYLLPASLLVGGDIFEGPGLISILGYTIWLSGFLVGLFAQVYRYRRVSTPAQRQQTKWVVFSLSVVILTGLAWSLVMGLFPSGPTRLLVNLFGAALATLLTLLFPISLFIAIQHYRLWDVDLIIRRTLVYAVLTGALALVYFGSVTLLQSMFAAVSGQQSAVAIVISTLAIAALFSPLRRRVQEFIDRRFYRRKYDAARTLATFAATVRDEVEMDKLAAELVSVVEETMQPERVGLWLRPASHRGPRATTSGSLSESAAEERHVRQGSLLR